MSTPTVPIIAYNFQKDPHISESRDLLIHLLQLRFAIDSDAIKYIDQTLDLSYHAGHIAGKIKVIDRLSITD